MLRCPEGSDPCVAAGGIPVDESYARKLRIILLIMMFGRLRNASGLFEGGKAEPYADTSLWMFGRRREIATIHAREHKDTGCGLWGAREKPVCAR